MNCPSCGTPADQVEQRFCRACGTALTAALAGVEKEPDFGGLWADQDDTAERPAVPGVRPAPPPPPPPPLTPPPGRPGSPGAMPAGEPAPERNGGAGRRALVVALVVLLAASIGIGGTLLLLGGNDGTVAEDPAASITPTAGVEEPTESADPTEDGTASSTSSPRPSATTTPTAPARFECWDGTMVASAGRCPTINGADGMTWVFPRSDDRSCRRTPGRGNRGFEATCTERVGGGEVEVHYSRWRSWDAMDRNYRDAARRSLQLRPDVHARVVASERADGKVAVWLKDRSAPYSVTIYADSARDAAAVFAQLGIRDRASLAGPGRR